MLPYIVCGLLILVAQRPAVRKWWSITAVATDIRTDYRSFQSKVAPQLTGRRVLVCSDDRAVIRSAEDILAGSQVFTVTETEDTGGQPLHHRGVSRDGDEPRRLTINMLVDLLCLASSRHLLVTASQKQCSNSGFSSLAKLLHKHPYLVNQPLS